MSPLKPTTIGHLEQITHLSCEISTRPIYGWVTHKTTAHKKKKQFPLLFQWFSPTFPMVVPYFSNGCPILFQWLSPTFPMVVPYFSSSYPCGFPKEGLLEAPSHELVKDRPQIYISPGFLGICAFFLGGREYYI